LSERPAAVRIRAHWFTSWRSDIVLTDAIADQTGTSHVANRDMDLIALLLLIEPDCGALAEVVTVYR
jgi:hypothetical protein